MEFDYSIEYKKGKENELADALSRKDSMGVEAKLYCVAMICISPEWVEDIKNNYPKDTNAAKYLEVIHSNTNQTISTPWKESSDSRIEFMLGKRTL